MATALVVTDALAGGDTSAPGWRCLDSWKQIASFFERTPRTVQRWERNENLPVRRHVHEKVSSVYAFERELIAWRNARSRKLSDREEVDSGKLSRTRLAVLPFANLSSDPRLRHFEDGWTDEIISQLACLAPGRLGLIARSTVLPYKAAECSIAHLGRSLGVHFVLEGTVRALGHNLRIAAQLIDVSDQTHVYGDIHACRWAEAASMQIAYAERTAKMISRWLLAKELPEHANAR